MYVTRTLFLIAQTRAEDSTRIRSALIGTRRAVPAPTWTPLVTGAPPVSGSPPGPDGTPPEALHRDPKGSTVTPLDALDLTRPTWTPQRPHRTPPEHPLTVQPEQLKTPEPPLGASRKGHRKPAGRHLTFPHKEVKATGPLTGPPMGTNAKRGLAGNQLPSTPQNQEGGRTPHPARE